MTYSLCIRWLQGVLVAMVLAGVCSAAEIDWADHPENLWVKQSPREGAPAPRYLYEGSGAWDPAARKFIRWGGHDGIPQGFHLFLWDLETGKWAQRFPNTSPPGACCIDGANVYDVAHRRFVRFPGASLNHGFQWFRQVQLKNSHVWLYDPATNTWTNMRPPPYKDPEKYSREVLGSLDAGGTYDANHEVAVSFGGQGAAGGMNNLFVYDAYSNRLQRLAAENPPSPRDGMGICYDTKNDCLVVFGSQYADDERTWIYRYGTNRWEALDLRPRPPGKKRKTYSTIPKMAFDSVGGVCLCLVWFDDEGGRLETWVLDVAKQAWTKMNPATEPGPTGSRARNLGYDRSLNLFISECVNPQGEAQIWTYRYRKAPPEDLPAPAANLHLTTDAGKALLRWEPSRSSGIKEYRVYRAQSDAPWKAAFIKVGTAKGTTYEDRGLAASKLYYYVVRAVGPDERESRPSNQARTQPRRLGMPVISVLAANQIEVTWPASPQSDVAGYNVYRGLATVGTSTTLKGSWAYNDPEYPEPVVDRVQDVTGMKKLNSQPLPTTRFLDEQVDLSRKGPESADYRYAVYAYLVRAVNRLGVESGPSPYALSIPAEPRDVMLRENGRGARDRLAIPATSGSAELRWTPSREKGIAGYRVYRVDSRTVARLTPDLIKKTRFTIRNPGHTRFVVVAVDALGQEGQPSSPVWSGQSYRGFFEGPWHQ
jgi:hypothetical protein